LVPDEYGRAVCYMYCEPSCQYNRVTTGSDRASAYTRQTICYKQH